VNSLASLVGTDWLENVRTATGRKIHPLQYPLVQTGEAWDRWRMVFDDAVRIVQQLVTSDNVARDRLIAKVKSPDFWSTVPEIVWAARLARLGADVAIEPIQRRKGPDMRFEFPTAIIGHAEVYSPVFADVEFDWATDLRASLEKLGAGFDVGIEVLPARVSQNLGVINRALRRVLTTFRDDNNQDRFRLYLWTDRKQRLEPMPQYITVEMDPVIDEDAHPFFVADVRYAPGLGGVYVSSHTPNAHRDPSAVLSDLGQLQPGGANILILDVTREFLIAPRIERECNAPNGVFERHPELSAVAVSAWGVYPGPTTNPLADEVFIEEYELIANPRAAWPVPADLLAAMQRPGLLG
jgi:hypothetical protein